MENRMILEIKDFGPIDETKIDLKKLNIIAGNNGSGKSTSSKLLFCFLTAVSKEGIYLANKSLYNKLLEFIVEWNNKLNNKFALIKLPENSLYDKYLSDNLIRVSSEWANS